MLTLRLKPPLAIAVLLFAVGCRHGDAQLLAVRIAIGGQNQLIYLPTTLANELGFYKDEGLNVDLQDLAGGSKALQALVGGSADVVSGFYDHTIQMAAEGRELVAFVTMLRFPGLVLITSPQRAATLTRIDDLKGRMLGVTTAGSSSHMLLTYLLKQHGVGPDGASVTAIGTAATAIAAVERGKVDAGMMADPAVTLLEQRSPGVRVLADLRTADGVKAALGADAYPASVLYAKGEWIRAHRDIAGRLTHAMNKTLDWMHGHSAQQIADRMPPGVRGDDPSLYVESLRRSMAMFSIDGAMTEDGAEAVRKILSQSIDKVSQATIDLKKTYTNEFLIRKPVAP